MQILCNTKNVTKMMFIIIALSLPSLTFGHTLQEITSTDVKKMVQAADEKVTVLCFWASWCKVCQKHIPELENVYWKYKGRDVEIIGVSLDDDAKKADEFIKKKGISFPVVVAQDYEEMRYIFQISKIPTLIYYLDGQKHHGEAGYTPPDHIEEDIESCLAGRAAPEKDEVSSSQ
ncbi:MAG: TlpA family protein disulfide reductase [Candidatus Brocadiaceae bacterium]|nr:TlpA family protein disulfide reductase [Candidatus Brocadiaceae bacterium]